MAITILYFFCRPSHDPVEDQLDSLTNMLQDALKTGSQDSLPGKSTEESQSSSQSSFIDHGSTAEGNEPSHMQAFRSRFRSDSGNESLLSDVSPTPPLKGTLLSVVRVTTWERFLHFSAILYSFPSLLQSCLLQFSITCEL